MKWLKLTGLILGSAWFFPVSCTTALYTGTHVIAHWDARDTTRGDTVHSVFSVVMESPKNNQPFQLVSLSDIPELKTKGKSYSFLTSHDSGNIIIDEYSNASYHVLKKYKDNQVIEVIYKDDNKTVWSKYRATQSDVTPLSSRMF